MDQAPVDLGIVAPIAAAVVSAPEAITQRYPLEIALEPGCLAPAGRPDVRVVLARGPELRGQIGYRRS
jgi:hypothetical protein